MSLERAIGDIKRGRGYGVGDNGTGVNKAKELAATIV
jgi:hypothetical protein